MARLVTPGSVTTRAVVEIDLADALELAEPQQHAVGERQRAARQRSAGAAGHHLMLCSWQYFRTFETCSVVSGSTTTIGGWR